MNEQKEMPVVKTSPPARFRYWSTPPDSLTIKVADIEPFVPKANWKTLPPSDLTFDIPAEKVLTKNVPRIPLRALAELLPDLISASDGVVKLPAAKLAASYRLVEHVEELIPEPEPEPETPPEPEKLPEPEIPAAIIPEKPMAPEISASPELPAELKSIVAPPKTDLPPLALRLDPPQIVESPSAPPPPAAITVPPAVPPPVAPPVVISEPPTAPANNDPAPISGLPEPANPPAVTPPLTVPQPEPASVASTKFPPRRTGSFVGLPIFRRKTPVIPPQPPAAPLIATPVVLPPVEPVPEAASPLVLPEIPQVSPQEIEEPIETISVAPEPPVDEPVLHLPPNPEPPELPEPAVPAMPVRMLRTEHFPAESQNQEIVEQEPLQALFLTEETMTVNRVIELCGGLPGVNSCVLAHGSIVVASHNVPESVDLVSMSAHASDMLKAMRDSSARMGVGTVPAVTLHTEKGVISFFNREDLTMLVFHKDRGFVPGVREKMAAVLGELTKARLTLPVGGEESD